jgi:NitT/TauT family transport system ATP-binding protein
MAGFIAPRGGSLSLDGSPITAPGPDRAVVFQTGALFEWMSARQNIEFSLFCRNVPAAERKKVSDQMIDLVGLTGFADHYPYELSGGMQQRVGVARVIAANPRIMLMDEPFAAVDVQTRESLQEELLRIHEATKCTIVFVTHSIEEAVFLSTRIFLVSRPHGRITQVFEVDLPSPRWNPLNRVERSFVEMRERIYLAMHEEIET